MAIIDRSLHQLLGGLVGRGVRRLGHDPEALIGLRSLSCQVDPSADGPDRWVSRDTVHVAPGARVVFRVDVRPDEEVLWSGATEEGFTLHSSLAVLCSRTSGAHIVSAEVYGPDRRLRQRLTAEVDVA